MRTKWKASYTIVVATLLAFSVALVISNPRRDFWHETDEQLLLYVDLIGGFSALSLVVFLVELILPRWRHEVL